MHSSICLNTLGGHSTPTSRRITDPLATISAYPYAVGPMVYWSRIEAAGAIDLAREAFGVEYVAGITIRDRRNGRYV